MKRTLVLLVAAVGLLAATAAPVSAGSTGRQSASPFCFGGLEQLLTNAANARGGKVREKPTKDLPTEVGPQAGAGSGFAVTIPIWFHVISPDGVVGDVKDSVLQRQLQVMNSTFAGTGFSYTLAGVTRTVNQAWYELPNTGVEQEMKKTLHVGDASTLNVYTTSGAGFLGWATFPTEFNSRESMDGIVIDYRSMPGGDYGREFSLGKTLTHEAGHWLGLLHTFQGGCNTNGDYVDDTPAMSVPTGGCPEGKDTCPEPGLDPIHNYMDYSFDSCYSEFTAGQTARMQDQWLAFRAG